MAALPARGSAAGDEDPAAGSPEPDDPLHDEAVPWEPVATRPDPMSEEEQQALLDAGSGRPAGPGTLPRTGALPTRFAGRVNLTIPMGALLGLAERPGEIGKRLRFSAG